MSVVTKLDGPRHRVYRDEDDARDTLGEYRSLMGREFRAEIERGGKPPVRSLSDALLGALALRTSDDPNARRQIGDALKRSMCGFSSQEGGFAVPRALANDFLGDIVGGSVTRTMSEITGSSGGFATRPEFYPNIVDRARLTLWPGNLGTNWWPTRTKRCVVPMDGSTSSSSTFTATWGTSELILPAASDTVLGSQELELSRLIVYCRVSRDLLADSTSINAWLSYRARVAIRGAIEYAMVNGGSTTMGFPAPAGVIGAASTVGVARTTTNQIAAADIDKLWQSISVACRPNVTWHASESAVEYLDSIDASGQYPRDLFVSPSTAATYGLPYGLIKGRPLIPLGSCPALGSPGDLFAVDWTQYILAYFDAWKTSESFLSFDVYPVDEFHRGTVGLPDAAVESRGTEHFSFSSDIVDVAFKARLMGAFVWLKPMTGVNGLITGPAAALS